jgi:polysaccharide deacetylase family protein (PEP-CTERM system associated)
MFLLLSFDLEDYNQLLHRALGVPGWDRRGAGFERQMGAVFGLLDELDAKATFFLLGVTIRHYPDVAREIASRGDEIACHGHDHQPVYGQSPDEFRRDVTASLELIEDLTGVRPRGFRAPAFSINRDTVWALEALAELGFEYDSSQYDSRKIPQRLTPVPAAPYAISLPSGRTLWEFPIPAWRVAGATIPIGGGSYWRVLPTPMLRRGLTSVTSEADHAALYFHPYEFDPSRLRLELGDAPSLRQRLAAARLSAISNPGRRRVAARIRRIARDYELISYEQALGDIESDVGTRTRALSERGVLV